MGKWALSNICYEFWGSDFALLVCMEVKFDSLVVSDFLCISTRFNRRTRLFTHNNAMSPYFRCKPTGLDIHYPARRARTGDEETHISPLFADALRS